MSANIHHIMNYDSPALPIDDYRQKIERTINTNPVTIITAETGAGKSTRVPLWFWQMGKRVHITQPRRIAARSLSHYLSALTKSKWGTEVGYQTGFDRKFSRETSLLYLTDGVKMQQEIKQQVHYDTLIIDEIHEWNLNQEVLVGLVKTNLEKNYYRNKSKRIIIMSATLQAEKLSEFFNNAPVITVPGRGHPVTMHHNHPHFLLSDTMQLVAMEKNILVFQPGKREIEDYILMINEDLERDKLKAKVLPLHSELSIKEQARVFDHYQVPKIVVATDIAQTSLTIDDIDAVIDTGIKKEIHTIKGIEGLYPVDISRSECMQRAGRAGRVKSGQYILCAEMAIEDRLPFPEPELRRLNLESATLRLIKWGISPLAFPYFHSPKKNLIHKAISQLKIFGAIDKEGAITSDGQRMAELPVAIRSARLLLEAMKGSKAVLAQALKLIAILETRGIVNKEYMGEKCYSGSPNSDLYNQLIIWQSEKLNKKIISFKKLSMAKEINRELKSRVQASQGTPERTPEDQQALFRAILSSFTDFLFNKIGEVYVKEGDEERQVDKNSILFTSKPEMVTGIPFDLVITRENARTGVCEKLHLPLLTFATEVSLKILDQLKPFSYRRDKEVVIEEGDLKIHHTVYFGGKVISSYHASPNWTDSQEKEVVFRAAHEWFRQHQTRFNFEEKRDSVYRLYQNSKRVLGGDLQPFNVYWKKFIETEIRNNLKNEHLDYFFKFSPCFQRITLKYLLPPPLIQRLKKACWPKSHTIAGKSLPISYIRNRPFISPPLDLFEKMTKDDLILASGEKAGIILKNRRLYDWEHVVYIFNQWKKKDIFSKKWKNLEKEVRLEDLEHVPFPQSFEGGRGMEGIKFEFYAVPKIQKENICLIHFLDREKAENYFNSVRCQWQDALRKTKKKKIENIFKEKGWKVKS